METCQCHDQKKGKKSDNECSNGGKVEVVKGNAGLTKRKEQQKTGEDVEVGEATFNPRTPVDNIGLPLHSM